jgi:hypothetical protein
MTTIERRLSDGARAGEILENEQFNAAFDAVEKDLVETWMNSKDEAQADRERCWSHLMLLRKVKAQLVSTLETGKLARIELNHRRTISERLLGTRRL